MSDITLGTPLANGATVDVRFLLGIQQTGSFRFGIIPEALPMGGNELMLVEGCTNGCPAVVSIVRADPNPTSASSVDFTVTFNVAVTGVDASDFALVMGGALAGATITNVTGLGATWTVTADTGTGDGTLGLNLVDDDTIVDGAIPLGGIGSGNGDFTGEVYTVASAPVVTSILRADASPTSAASVDFTVTFNEAVTGVDATDFALVPGGSVAGASITSVIGAGAVWTVTADRGTGDGTLGLNLVDDNSIVDADLNPLGGPAAGDGSFIGEVYTIAEAPVVVSVVVTTANPTSDATAVFRVTFSEPVTGVDASDFVLTTAIPGTSIVSVVGAGTTWDVTIDTGDGTAGTIRLDVVDDDTIVDAALNPLGGVGAGNGNFTTGVTLEITLAVSGVPALDPTMLMLLALALAGFAIFAIRNH